tara:strand:+ start:176 stop:733 length:558 start_codon:yes stop_codon:yes gene_type:complete
MVSREILSSHPVTHLRKEISKTNIKGASKMKKAALIDVMMKHKDRFSHITMMKKAPKKEAPKKDAPKKEAPKKEAPKKEAPKKKPNLNLDDMGPNKDGTIPKYDKATAKAVADLIVFDMKKKKVYKQATARSVDVMTYLKQHTAEIKKFASKISAGGLAGLMRHKSVKGLDEEHSRDHIADLLTK